jgi:hypothetical protein
MELFGIDTPIYLSSSYKVQGRKGDLVLALCVAHGAKSYLAGRGSFDYMQEYLYKFQSAGISVFWHNFIHPFYQAFLVLICFFLWVFKKLRKFFGIMLIENIKVCNI